MFGSKRNRRAFLSPKALDSWPATLLAPYLEDRIPLPSSLQRSNSYARISRRAMACDFTLFFPAKYPSIVEAGCAALDEIQRLERKLSVYREDSEVTYLNRHGLDGDVVVDDELFTLLGKAARITQETGSAFDVAAGALVKAWGFFRGPKRVPPESELSAAMASSGTSYVKLDAGSRTVRFLRDGVEINLGSIGKGYAIDRALELIGKTYNARCVLMHGGQSSLKGIGAPPGEPRGWKVEIGDPHRSRASVASVWLKNRALGTSSAANQWFVDRGRQYGHILDPRTGWPAEGLASASAIASSAAEADSLSTAFFVMGIEATKQFCEQHPGIGAVLVTQKKAKQKPQVIALGTNVEEVELH